MKRNAFTLVEVLVYLGIFAILMGGILTAAFNVFESSNRDQTKIMIQKEGDFLVAKINRALTDAKNFNVTGNELSVERWNGSVVVVNLSGTDLNFTEGANPPAVLNNSNVEISNLVFIHITNPENIKASFTISARTPNGMIVSEDFSTTKYLRK